jgi:hypothetical protein
MEDVAGMEAAEGHTMVDAQRHQEGIKAGCELTWDDTPVIGHTERALVKAPAPCSASHEEMSRVSFLAGRWRLWMENDVLRAGYSVRFGTPCFLQERSNTTHSQHSRSFCDRGMS